MIERYSRPEMKQVWSDENKFNKWLEVEIAVCEAWAEEGVIPRKAIPKIKMAKINFKRMEEILKETRHDVTAFLGSIQESIGEESRYIHLGLTSSDIMDTATSLQLMEAADILAQDIKDLTAVLAQRAIEHKYTLQIGRTHGVHAEPTTFGLKLALMYDEFGRALRRLERARDTVAVGKISGAVGTHAYLRPAVETYICRKLGLRAAAISTQIIQRDRHAEYLSALALVGCSIDRWAQEFRHLQRSEVLEAEEFFAAGQKGSSAMPHKRNPITCERLCGLARVLRGNALAAMENVALWHERDISHSSVERVILPDSTTLLDYMLGKLTAITRQLLVYPARMKANLESSKGLIYSQAVLLALTRKGLTREQAYELVQRNAMKTWADARTFQQCLLDDVAVMRHLTRAEVERLFDLRVHLKEVSHTFRKVGIQ